LAGFVDKPQKTWFIERVADSYIFASGEREAHAILHRADSRGKFKVVGVSDGTTYYKMVRGAKDRLPEIKGEVTQLKSDLNRYNKTYERMKFDDLLEATDPKFKKVKEEISRVKKEIKTREGKLKDFSRSNVQDAFNAELAIAKENGVEMPTSQDVITPDAKDRDRILRQMGQ
jgi:archaellum component FlaC